MKRVLIKLSGEALGGNDEKGFNDSVIDEIVEQIAIVHNKNVEISVVVGGGNFWRGRNADSVMDRVRADQIGMIATIMNAIYLTESFRKRGINAVVMTPIVVGNVSELFCKRAALQHMKNKTIVIFAAGTGHPYFSTDTITAIRAAELEVDVILFAKNVDGIYDSDPRINENAVKIKRMTYRDIITSDLRVIDIAASALCEDQNLRSVIFGLNEKNGIDIAIFGTDEEIYEIGTLVTN